MIARRREELEFGHMGCCPQCGDTDGFLNIGRNHIGRCDTHKTAWSIGSNLFSAWRDEDESIWRANADKLADYEEVEPIHFKDELPGYTPPAAPEAWALDNYIIERHSNGELVWTLHEGDERNGYFACSGPCEIRDETLVLLDDEIAGGSIIQEPAQDYLARLPAWTETTHYLEQRLMPRPKPTDTDTIPF